MGSTVTSSGPVRVLTLKECDQEIQKILAQQGDPEELDDADHIQARLDIWNRIREHLVAGRTLTIDHEKCIQLW